MTYARYIYISVAKYCKGSHIKAETRFNLFKIKPRHNFGTYKMPKKALVLIASGTEEMEFVITADILVRGGIEVTTAGVPNKDLKECSRGIKIQPNISIAEACQCADYDAIVLPGGLGGAAEFCKSKEVGDLLKDFESKQKIIAAICAGPTSFKAHGVALGKSITTYPSLKSQVEGSYKYLEQNVVIDGNIVTSRGPATSFEFGIALVEKLVGKEKASEVSKAMLLTC